MYTRLDPQCWQAGRALTLVNEALILILRYLCNRAAGRLLPSRGHWRLSPGRARANHGAQGTMQEHVKREHVETAKADTHHARDLRTALAWLKAQGDLIETDKTVDPDLQVTGLQKHMDGGCPVMFNNVKDKPHERVMINMF